MRLLIAMVAAILCSPAIAADYLGKVLAVSDGDTFTMEADGAKVRVRICGIDAPERGQAGYGQAAGVLSSMIEGKTVHCRQVGEGTEVGAIHPKAMPVILTTPDEVETWMTAPPDEVLKLQRSLSDGSLKIVARGAKEDPAGQTT